MSTPAGKPDSPVQLVQNLDRLQTFLYNTTVKAKVRISSFPRSVDTNTAVMNQPSLFKREEKKLINLNEASIWRSCIPTKVKL